MGSVMVRQNRSNVAIAFHGAVVVACGAIPTSKPFRCGGFVMERLHLDPSFQSWDNTLKNNGQLSLSPLVLVLLHIVLPCSWLFFLVFGCLHVAEV